MLLGKNERYATAIQIELSSLLKRFMFLYLKIDYPHHFIESKNSETLKSRKNEFFFLYEKCGATCEAKYCAATIWAIHPPTQHFFKYFE